MVSKGKDFKRPFQFVATWLMDNSFKEVVEKAWKDNKGWSAASNKFVDDVRVWNKEVFGNIFRKKKGVVG